MKLLDLIVISILSFQIIDIFFMNFATIILFLPTTLPHTHDPRHLATLEITGFNCGQYIVFSNN